MAKYKDIGGTAIQSRSGAEEYTYPSPEGELFYNAGNGQFQFVGLGGGNWATGGNMNQARYAAGSDGTLTAAIIAGGYSSARVANVEQYNGSSWTEVADLNDARYSVPLFGTSSSALAVGGDTPPYTGNTESWNNSSWTEVNDLNTARRMSARAGASNTSGLIAGGYASPGYQAIVETWDGSSWTEVGDMNTARDGGSGAGIVTAAIVAAEILLLEQQTQKFGMVLLGQKLII